MKRILLTILLFLLLCAPSWACDDDACRVDRVCNGPPCYCGDGGCEQFPSTDPIQLARMSPAILGSGSVVAISCASCQGPAACTSVALGCSYRETYDGSTDCGDSSHTNCDLTWTYTTSAPDYNSTTHILQGSYSKYETGSGVYDYVALTAADEYYGATYDYLEALPSSDGISTFRFNTSSTAQCALKIDANGHWLVLSTGGTAQTSTASQAVEHLVAGNGYYYKIRGKKVASGTSECEGWVSTDGKTWGTSLQSYDGTWTNQINRLYTSASNSAAKHNWDDSRVYSGDISW